jgi:hypothetical protein
MLLLVKRHRQLLLQNKNKNKGAAKAALLFLFVSICFPLRKSRVVSFEPRWSQ